MYGGENMFLERSKEVKRESMERKCESKCNSRRIKEENYGQSMWHKVEQKRMLDGEREKWNTISVEEDMKQGI